MEAKETNMTESFSEVPILLIHKDNIAEYWPKLTDAIKTAAYLAMDLEMTGLGNRRELNSKCIESRYAHMIMVAQSRSIVSIGLSCFQLEQKTKADPDSCSEELPNSPCLKAETFNIILLCDEDYVVEPISLKFLVEHGFDFNQQYSRGVPYYRGNDQPNSSVELCHIRDLFSEIVRAQVPVVLHNALVDLVFMYGNFYCNLPAKMETFMADMCDIFSGGIVDTKYICDYIIRWPSSYLEYTFRRCQIENHMAQTTHRDHVTMTFPAFSDDNPDVEYRECGLPVQHGDRELPEVCENYASHGNCREPDTCRLSHDIDVVLALEFRDGIQYYEPKKKKRKRKLKDKDKLSYVDRSKNKNTIKSNEADTSTKSINLVFEPTENNEQSKLLTDNTGQQQSDSILTESRHDGSNLICTEQPETCSFEMDTSSSHESKSLNENRLESARSMDTVSDRTEETEEKIKQMNLVNGHSETQRDQKDDKVSKMDTSRNNVESKDQDISISRTKPSRVKCSGHRAGFDAFMTGFILAKFLCEKKMIKPDKIDYSEMPDILNSIYMCGKDIPLQMRKGAFAKNSKSHLVKFNKIREGR